MTRNVVVVAPHPDDETLGCGGTLLRHMEAGDKITWMIMTSMHLEHYTASQIRDRDHEIAAVARAYGCRIVRLDYPAGQLDEQATRSCVDELRKYFTHLDPGVVYAPYWGDAHNDHTFTQAHVAIALKQFPRVGLRLYETPSETEYASLLGESPFTPNLYVDITSYMDQKIDIMKYYQSEIPMTDKLRSVELVVARNRMHGAMIGSGYAEAFMLLRDVL